MNVQFLIGFFGPTFASLLYKNNYPVLMVIEI